MIECREARFDELPAVARLRQRMAQEMGGDWDVSHPGWRTRFAQFFGGKQSSGRGQVIVALDGERTIGTAVITMVDDYRSFSLNIVSAHVNAVYVEPGYRRRGVARNLLRLAIDWARRHGCVRVRLRSSDEGVALYESLGFCPGREMELML